MRFIIILFKRFIIILSHAFCFLLMGSHYDVQATTPPHRGQVASQSPIRGALRPSPLIQQPSQYQHSSARPNTPIEIPHHSTPTHSQALRCRTLARLPANPRLKRRQRHKGAGRSLHVALLCIVTIQSKGHITRECTVSIHRDSVLWCSLIIIAIGYQSYVDIAIDGDSVVYVSMTTNHNTPPSAGR